MNVNWRKQHRWSAITVLVFLALLCVSGILLNHRESISGIEVSRTVLPPFYRYHDWNGGLLRGSVSFTHDGQQAVALYGNGGVWLTDRAGRRVRDFNSGLPRPMSARNIRAMALGPDSVLYALSTERLYAYLPDQKRWRTASLGLPGHETYSDMTVSGDSLVVLSRSYIYVKSGSAPRFRRLTLAACPDIDPEQTTLFRKVWDLHSGRMFGTPGILVADVVALLLLFLCISGLLLLLFPGIIRRIKSQARKVRTARCMRFTLKGHRLIGLWSIAFTLLICLTGWCLRPPVLLLLATTCVPSGSAANPWQDKLRMVRHADGMWLISTSDGFVTSSELSDTPRRPAVQPPVSVMGLNAWSRHPDGRWVCGSFSGIYLWNIECGEVTDYFSGRPADLRPGPPFGKTAVAGYTEHIHGRPLVVTYDDGCADLHQPEALATLPMPLWNVAQETHTGRIFFGKSATWFYIFVVGAVSLWCLLTGLMLTRRKR